MAYEQCTKCVSAASYLSVNPIVQAAFSAFMTGAVISFLFALIPLMPSWLGTLLGLASADWTCYLFAVFAGCFFGVISYCDWWLTDRLICLGGGGAASDRCVIGMLVSVAPPWEKKGLEKYDTDYSINILPLPNKPKDKANEIYASQPYGWLMSEQAETKDKGLVFTGETATDKLANVQKIPVLHGEFEGAGIVVLRNWAQVALGLTIAAILLCLTPWGKVLAVFFAIFAFLAMMVGLSLAPTWAASPKYADPTLGELHVNNSDGKGADILAVFGRWVYDAGHNHDWNEGWNEIHPIKMCLKILAPWDGNNWSTGMSVNALVVEVETQIKAALAETTVQAQKAPENQWQLHPSLDGCRPSA